MISKFSVKKPYTVLVGVVMAIVLGVVSFTKMTTDLLPNLSLPYVIVMTTYIGASPETVEMVVTKPVESSMATVSNIENISSISGENYSMVILEFAQNADMNSVSLEIRENLDQIKSYWDDSVGSPIIMKMNPDMMPIMVAAVGQEGVDDAGISDLAKNTIVPELESIEGVASASATGLLEESVNVIIRQDKIDAINRQVFGYIDSELGEKEQEIEDARKEIEDGKKEIEDGRVDLVDAQNELKDSRQEIEENKADLEKGKQELEDGKRELEEKKEEAVSKLAEAEAELLTAKADLEAAKINITSQITLLDELQKKLEEALEDSGGTDGLNRFDEQIAEKDGQIAQTESEIAQTKEEIARIDGEIGTYNAVIEYAGNYSDQTVGYVQEYLKIDPPSSGSVEEIDGVLNEYPNDMSVGELIDSLEGRKAAKEEEKSALDMKILELEESKIQLEEEKMELELQKKQVEAIKEEIESQLQQAGIDITNFNFNFDEIKNKIREPLGMIEENLEKVNAGLKELYKGNLKAAAELANAQSKIDLGEFQMDLAETQLEAGEKQIEAGQEQIDDGFKQLKDALEQLKEGEEQLEDGAKQLEEAREDAYASADMNDILTVDTVKSLLAAQNFSMPGGYVTEDGIDYLVRVGDKTQDIKELAAMPIMNPDMDGVDIITLADVADVFMTDNSAEIYTNINGSPGVLLTIQKQTGYSTGDVSDKLKDRFEEMMSEDESLSMIILMDQGIYIDMVVDSVISNVLFGAVLAILILIIFLKDIRPTLVIALSIPVSLVTAVVCMYFSGITLNIISLSGLALGVGMLVDNSIVVIENIYRMRSEGKSMRDASIEGAREVAGAIMASTLTTVCVFLPIVFTEGITRQLFVDMGLTIAYSLLASLFIALTVVPAMASKMLTKTKEQKEDKFFTKVIDGYGKVLEISLRWKPVVLTGVLVLLAVSAAAAVSRGTAFMPDMESTQMTVSVTMPEGTPLEETARTTDDIIERIRTLEDVEDVGAMASTSSLFLLTGGGDSVKNATEIYVTLREDKELTGDELAKKIEELTADIEEAELVINTSSMDMSALGGSGISIQVRGREIDTLQTIAADIAQIVRDTEGTTEVSDGMEDSTEELRIIIDRDKAIGHGLTVAQIFQQISAKLADASSATTLETEIREYDVYVKNANDIALTRDTVKKIKIDVTKKDGTKEKITLADIADFETKQSPNAVNRADQNRYIGVSAAIADGYNIGLVSQELQKKLDAYEMPEGYTLVMSGENEMITEAMEQVSLMLVLALLFMYLIMVAQFQSLLSPFIIMFTVPLAFTGGFFGLYLSGSEVSVIALIGFVMLSGIIVNNGIVLVDYINQLREAGMEKKEAIMEAGRTRLRPVLMTALTTILALSTMVFGNDMGSEMGRPMAVVTIGGLVYGTLLTLVVVPCIYDIFMREKRRKKNEGKNVVSESKGTV
ncbi:MAG: MMPL family transporter [Lachnospiraceae bacterium]|jgi:multidrug efflux pump subunit AcrB|nr:MMPL family transporter [Lachnospiraceae bacterium]